MSVHELSARSLDGEDRALSDFAGRVLLIVNVASECGLTPHYAGLQALYAARRADGLEVLGFPCNQFGAQEPGSADEIKSFCETRYGVDFPMFEKIEVNGAGRHPLFAWLCTQDVGPDGAGDVSWNFAKFVVGRDGRLVARFSPETRPDAPALLAAIDAALAV